MKGKIAALATSLCAFAALGVNVKYNLWNCNGNPRAVSDLREKSGSTTFSFGLGQVGDIVAVQPFWGLRFVAEETNCVINMSSNVVIGRTWLPISVRLERSRDMVSWTGFDPNGSTPVALKDVGDVVFFRAIDRNAAFGTSNGYYRFTTSAKCKCLGSVMSLLYNSEEDSLLDGNKVNDYAFYHLFWQSKITTFPSLPAVTVGVRGYSSMFRSSLEAKGAVFLPATNIAESCYSQMFESCRSMTHAPDLPATKLYRRCYHYMFNNCWALAHPPRLPATTMTNECYLSMLSNCRSLKEFPELPSESLAPGCYSHMFELSAITNAVLPALELADSCYEWMFSNCSDLKQVDARFSSFYPPGGNRIATTNWVNRVKSSGTFYYNNRVPEIIRDDSHFPIGWSLVEKYSD